MNRWNYLSENSSSSSDEEYPDPKLLEGTTFPVNCSDKFDMVINSRLIENAYQNEKKDNEKLNQNLTSQNYFLSDVDNATTAQS